MRKYAEVTKLYFKAQLAWRADVFFQMVFTVSKILFAYLLWGIIFEGREMVAEFTFHGMLSYYIISSFLSQLDVSAGLAEELSGRIRNGTFSNFMVLPIGLQRYFMSMEVGVMAFYLAFDFLAAVVWIFLFGIEFVVTKSVFVAGCALVIIVLGLFFMLQLNYFLGILTLKYEEISTFLMIKNNLMMLITGSIVPLTLFPEGVLNLMRCLPFYYVTYLPSMLLTGQCEEEALLGVAVLVGWCVVMQMVIKVTWERYRKKYDGVGI